MPRSTPNWPGRSVARLTVLPGVRGEYHGRQGGVVAPRLALAARPSDAWTLRAGVGRGFRTPSAEEFGFNFDHSVYGYKVIGNRALQPERSWGVNGDVAFRPAAFVTLRAGGFANWVHDLIDIDLGSARAQARSSPTRTRTSSASRPLVANLGLTLLGAEHYRADLAYDYLWTRDELSGQPLSGRAPHTLTASSRLSLPWRFELDARARFVSDAFVDSKTRTPGYQAIDARIAFSPWPSADAYAGVLNLLDVHQEPGRVGDLRPPLGRVLYVGLSVGLPSEEGP
ncbi:MAG: TonB-dependent receptor [Pseudomonadota bacterium]